MGKCMLTGHGMSYHFELESCKLVQPFRVAFVFFLWSAQLEPDRLRERIELTIVE